jgi:hypothetical protein
MPLACPGKAGIKSIGLSSATVLTKDRMLIAAQGKRKKDGDLIFFERRR